MKLTFSTVACPNYSWSEIYPMAKDLGFSGVEVRLFGSRFTIGGSEPFSEANLPRTLAQLREKRIEISCVSSGVVLKFGNRFERNLEIAREHIDLAASLGAKFLRLLGDLPDAPQADADDSVVRDAVCELAPYAEERGVMLLLETNGVYADTARLRDLIFDIGSENVGVLWDMHHPYRYFGETPEQTVQNLGAYIKYTHVKDSVMENGSVSYRVMGEGDLPMEEFIRALSSIKYDGYISLEWIKHYLPDLGDAGIVFPQFVSYMSQFLGEGPGHGRLQTNNAGTGKYVWPKDQLIDYTFPQVLDRMCEEFPDQIAFRYVSHDYTRTYEEFRNDVDTFARALIAMGVKAGDHVSIWATNVPQWFITFWATTKIGAVLVTVNTAYKIHEAEYLLRQSDTHTLVMVDGYKDSNYVEIIRKLCPELEKTEKGAPLHARRVPFLRNIVTVDCEMPGCRTWDEAMALSEETPIEQVWRRAAAISKHDVCNIQYTSGTTGFPKGVMLTHNNIVNNGKTIGDRMDLSTADRFLIHVPMFHCFGMVLSMTACMTHGAAQFPVPAFSPSLALDIVNSEKITAVNGVPTMFIAMLNHPDFEKTDFSHMRTGIMAGSPCPIKVMEDVLHKMNATEITIVFGQTESSPGCTQSSSDDPIEVKVGTVGRPLPGIECRIVDPETYEELPDGVDGEFVARGYNIMKGYYKMPAATAAAIDSNGWLHTGDVARRDENGNFKITGRIKDMIIRGGENIYPKEIEDFIYNHPSVSDVQVIGVPDTRYGEEIMACVILKEGEAMTEADMKKYVSDHMAKHKTPRYVRFVDSFPMNAAGKILKYQMRQEAVDYLGLGDAAEVATA